MKVSIHFKWYDLWIGLYVDRKNKTLYFIPFPTIVFKITKKKKKMKCEGWEGEKCNSNKAERYRMNTVYVEDEKNYRILCPDCQKACDAYWKEMWDELHVDIYQGIRDTQENY